MQLLVCFNDLIAMVMDHSACPVTTGEDCLYLTVYTPPANELAKEPAPIMVFYHGGEFVTGHGGYYAYHFIVAAT